MRHSRHPCTLASEVGSKPEVAESWSPPMEAILAGLMADEESVLELQSILGSSDSYSPRQQALSVARQHMQAGPRTDVETFRVLHTLGAALGATRTEASTIKALHA